MSEQLTVARRAETEVGTNASKRLRKAGRIPAVLYGHGEPPATLSVPAEELEAVVKHGAHVIELKGDLAENALVQAVQWNAYGTQVLHVDLIRVSKGERREVSVSLELKGEAPGVRDGGILQMLRHEVEIECPIESLPDRIAVNIAGLELGGSLTAADVPLPTGATLLTDPHELIVRCSAPAAEEEPTPGGPPEASEPERIGRKEKSEEESEE